MDEAPHILVVDDDRRLRHLLLSFLGEHGFRATAARSAAEARACMEGLVFDAIVLDVMMPGESGVRFTETLRGSGNTVPILMLSALAESQDRIGGLTAGSDDYLPKPFEPQELLLRLRNLLRRSAGAPRAEESRFGDFTFHSGRGELRRNGVAIHLTTRERDMLRVLVKNAGQTVARGDLAPPGSEEGVLRAVDVQINRLRQKIESDPSNPMLLQTVRGAGYVLHAG